MDVVSVQAQDHSPQRAALIANTYAQQYIALRQAADRMKIKQGEDLLIQTYNGLTPAERAGPRGTDLQQQLDKFQALASIQTGNAELSQPADVPSSPSTPKPVRNGILGLLLGVVVGLGAASYSSASTGACASRMSCRTRLTARSSARSRRAVRSPRRRG